MKFTLLALLSLLFVAEAFAQRYNPRRGSSSTARPTRTVVVGSSYNDPYNTRRDDRVIIRNRVNSYPSVRVVGPRYNPPGRSYRTVRTVIRPWNWSYTNSLSCDWSNTLTMNGRYIHDFFYNSDCQQAIYDIQNYGDFCDNADLYDQTGILEARFSYEGECRNALGWYY